MERRTAAWKSGIQWNQRTEILFWNLFSSYNVCPGEEVKSISEISPAWKSLFLPQRINPIIFSRSIQDQEPTKKPLEGKDFQNGQFHLSEYHRLLLEACQFARYTSEHPLEKWTVCSLPNLYKSFCWEMPTKTLGIQNSEPLIKNWKIYAKESELYFRNWDYSKILWLVLNVDCKYWMNALWHSLSPRPSRSFINMMSHYEWL